MSGNAIHMLSLIVTVGAVTFAIAVALITLRMTAGTRGILAGWQSRFKDMEARSRKAEAAFGSFPGLVLVWEDPVQSDDTRWGDPKIYGSPMALASLVDDAEPGQPKSFARRLLDGIAEYEAQSQKGERKTLRQHIQTLRETGETFSATVIVSKDKILQVDGRTAGPQVVIWIEDTAVRADAERAAITRLQKDRMVAASDPLAFVDTLNRAPFVAWRMSGKGRINWANAAYIKAVGAESLQQVLSEQILLDSQIIAQCQQTLEARGSVTDIRHVVMAGERCSANITMYPVSGGVAATAVDATETEALRENLSRHMRAHDETLDIISEAVVVFNPDKTMQFFNTAFLKLFQHDEKWLEASPTHNEWLGRLRERDMLPPHDDYREFKASELNYYENWPEEVPDELWPMADGRTLRLARMRHPMGGLLLVFEDITTELNMQSRYNTLIKVQKATLDKLTEGIAVFGSDGRLRLSNSAFEDLWHLNRDELGDAPAMADITRGCLRLYHDRIFWAGMQARITDPSPEARQHVIGEIERSDDTILTYLSRPLPDGATLVAWNDVTEARKTQAALIERAEALETADRLKSEFVGHVSYQLRTPLTTIKGFADLLDAGISGELTPRQQDNVQSILIAAEQLTKTIDDILDISAIEANTLDLDLGDVDVFDLLENSMEYLTTKVEDTEVHVKLECAEDIGIIRADERRLKQVIYNLLLNAVRATNGSGEIKLGAKRLGRGISLWVQDDGEGIAPEKQAGVFESFQSSRDGAGLGLSLVQRFVELHGGWVELESEPGKGTKVLVHLPEKASTIAAHPELDLLSAVGA